MKGFGVSWECKEAKNCYQGSAREAFTNNRDFEKEEHSWKKMDVNI